MGKSNFHAEEDDYSERYRDDYQPFSVCWPQYFLRHVASWSGFHNESITYDIIHQISHDICSTTFWNTKSRRAIIYAMRMALIYILIPSRLPISFTICYISNDNTNVPPLPFSWKYDIELTATLAFFADLNFVCWLSIWIMWPKYLKNTIIITMKKLNTYLYSQCRNCIIYRLLSFHLIHFKCFLEATYHMLGLSMIKQTNHKNYVTELLKA